MTSADWARWAGSQDVQERGFAKYPYRYQFRTVSGYHVQLAEKSASVPDVRIDFNPAKCDGWRESLPRLVSCLRSVRITRADFAIDYPFDLSGCRFETPLPVSTCTYRDRSQRLETHYLGAPSASHRWRVYNKALESGLTGTLWRVEAQIRFSPNDSFWQCSPFEGFRIYLPGQDLAGLKIQEKAMCEYLENHPEAWGQLDRKSRAKYKAFMSFNQQEIQPSPGAVFKSQSNMITERISQILSGS